MKAITLQQPWAGLLVLGLKQFETRSWNTKYRGIIAVHSSAKITKPGLELIEMLKENFISRFSEDSEAYRVITQTGVILGEVKITDTFSTNGDFLPSDEWEQAFGDYSPNRWFWECENPIVYDEPVPAKGQLSIWNWEPIPF